MPADPPHDDDRRTPPERDLERRAATPAVSPWVVAGIIAMAVGAVYVASALF